MKRENPESEDARLFADSVCCDQISGIAAPNWRLFWDINEIVLSNPPDEFVSRRNGCGRGMEPRPHWESALIAMRPPRGG